MNNSKKERKERKTIARKNERKNSDIYIEKK